MGKLINSDDIPWDVEGIGFIPVIGKDEIDAMPEGVVRCKDCRWFEYDGYHTNCKIMRFCVETEDYCSRGERREDGGLD